MSSSPKGAFTSHPMLARKVALKRSFARVVLYAERLLPLLVFPVAVLAIFVSVGWFGIFRIVPEALRWVLLAAFALAFLWSLLPLTRLRWPSSDEADRLLEERNNLPHQPVAVQEDEPAFETPLSRALWKEHQLRMARRIADLDAGLPRPDIARHDRFALRAVPSPPCFSPLRSDTPSPIAADPRPMPFGRRHPRRKPIPTCASTRG